MEKEQNGQSHPLGLAPQVAGLGVLCLLLGLGLSLLWQGGSWAEGSVAAPTLGDLLWNPTQFVRATESQVRSRSPYRSELRELYSQSLVAQGKREFGNFYIIKAGDGFLYQTNYYQEMDKNTMDYAQSMARLKRRAASAGTQVLFVGAGGKALPKMLGDGYPTGRVSLHNLDALFLDLHAVQVENLDLRSKLPVSPTLYPGHYYRTDSSPTARAALYSAGEIAGAVEEAFGIPLDADGFYTDPANYQTKIYPQRFQGDYGRSVGVAFGSLDDFVLLKPNFETDLTLVLPDGTTRGSFAQAVLEEDELETERVIEAWDMHFGEQTRRMTLINHQNPQGERVLFISDQSFFTTAAYLALACGQVDILLPATLPQSELEALAAGGDYSLVVVACQAQSVGPEMFSFFTSGAAAPVA